MGQPIDGTADGESRQGFFQSADGQRIELPSFKSLLIEVRRGEMSLATATGVLVSRTRETHCTLITNRHVVTGRHQDNDQALNRNGALPDNVIIHFIENPDQSFSRKPIRLPLYRPSGEPFWIEHPNLGAGADIVALNVRWGSDVTKLPYYLDTDHDRIGMEVGPAEPVSVIGFPFGLSSSANFPIWATGFLAQELSLLTPQHPVFLIDCRARAGQSGSAVIAFRAGNYRKRQEGRVVSTLSPNVCWEFLGIYSGRVSEQSDLGRVWHVSILGELVDAAAQAYRD